MSEPELKQEMSCRHVETKTGVSKATVSRFLNSGYDISLSTAKKLLPVLKACPCCARADLANAVKVKPLTFEEYNLTGKNVDGFELLKRSLNRSYNYWLDRRLSDGFFMVRFDQSMSHQTGGKTEEEAISNASKEHERRILSALANAPSPGQPATEQPDVREDHEALIDEIEDIISETHDIDVTDRKYAENIVGWLQLHHPAALRALEGGEA